jgi:hypothetical protein
MADFKIGDGITVRTITDAEVRAEQVRLWGEEKVAANEADVARRFGTGERGAVSLPLVIASPAIVLALVFATKLVAVMSA